MTTGDDSEDFVRRLIADAQNRVDLQYQLGTMYEEGQGVPKYDEQAAAWYRKAAEQGHADAQFNLGTMYAEG